MLSPRLTIDVRLLMDLSDAEQTGPLLFTALPSLLPRQGGLEVELVAAAGEVVPIPECITVIAYKEWERKGSY